MGCQAASQQLLLTKGKLKTASWSWLCKIWLFYSCFLFFLNWKTGLSFHWGVTLLGQSQNSRHWAAPWEQLLWSAHGCAPLYTSLLHWSLSSWQQHFRHLRRILFPILCNKIPVLFPLPDSFPKIKSYSQICWSFFLSFWDFILHQWSFYWLN